MSRLIIAGGGLAGSLAAMAIARRRPDVELTLIEQGETFGGNHTWSWFDTDVAAEHDWVLERISARRWPDHEVRFPKRRRTIAIGYNSIRSPDLDTAVRATLSADQYRLGAEIVDIGADHVLLNGGERIDADGVLDARGSSSMLGQQLAWQKFVGRIYRFSSGHGVTRPVIMDATVPQHDGYRFLYLLPLNEADVLIEDTYYSARPQLEMEVLRERLGQAASSLRAGDPEVVDEESGVLPILVEGDFDALWPTSDLLPRIGVRAGLFHPTTSYSLPDAVRTAALLSQQADFKADALAAVLRGHAERQWRERSFFELLNRMLFRAAEPDQSYRVLEHFYRLPPPVIGRFYSARLTAFDKMRILTGRPPVPLGRALSSILGHAA